MHRRQRIDDCAQPRRQCGVREFLIGERRVAADVRRLERIQHRQLRRRGVVRHVRMPMLVDVFRLAVIAQLNHVRVLRHSRIRVAHQRTPTFCERHLIFRRQLLRRKRQYVVFTEERVQRLPRGVVDMPNVDVLDDRSERSRQTAHAHDVGQTIAASRSEAAIRFPTYSAPVFSPSFRCVFRSGSWQPSSCLVSCFGVLSRPCSSSRHTRITPASQSYPDGGTRMKHRSRNRHPA